MKEKDSDVKIVGADPVGSILKEYFYTSKMGEARPYKVEGVGEDIIPGTTHFEYIDEIIEVSDKESFNVARRISREDGILIGGSGGLAAAAALKVAKDLSADKIVVVLFPDGGVKYLTTFYSDNWMRENRFLDLETVSLDKALATKPGNPPAVVSVAPGATVREAIGLMKERDISQIPVLEDGRSVGRLEEGEIMGQVISDNALLDTRVRDVMQESLPVVSSQKNIGEARNYLAKQYSAVLVEEKGAIIGIITKSDLLEFIVS